MDLEGKIELALKPPTEEIVTHDDLHSLFETNSKPRHYIGLEASGLLHVGSLFGAGFKIRDLQKAGVECTVFLADWHSVINNKFGGDWKKILGACDYYREAFQFFCPGVKTVLGTDLYARDKDYWRNVVLFSKHVTLARNARCLTIMGRIETERLDLAQQFYPPMQATDIHALDVDIAHAGMDQRKVHMLAREVFPKMGWKPFVALHHHLIPGLQGGNMSKNEALKMSKSKPDSCVFVHDSGEEIRRKLAKAYCPERVTEGNPVLEFAKFLVFHEFKEMKIERPAKFGGEVRFASYSELEKAFAEGKLHPADLKNGTANALDEIIAPVRKHFEKKRALLEVYK